MNKEYLKYIRLKRVTKNWKSLFCCSPYLESKKFDLLKTLGDYAHYL